MRKNSLVETFFRALRRSEPRGTSSVARLDAGHRSSPKRRPQQSRKVAEEREDSVAARDRRMHEFPLSMSSKTVAKVLKTEGYSPKTTIYHIEFRVRHLREKRQRENVQAK